jgi:1-acyl-sn-glycerol-3-phosphate acyltransferase
MKLWWYRLRSAVAWPIALLFFGVAVISLLTLGLVWSQRRLDSLMRFYFRVVVRICGGRLRYHMNPQYDANRVCVFVTNHVNLFDPFVLYKHVGFSRGLELESHFKIPFYGWLMGKWDNVPVPDEETLTSLKRTLRLTKQALESGTSLFVFAEGHRTLDGTVGTFKEGAFVMAQRFKYPVVPVSIVGSYRFKRKGSLLLRPGPIDIYYHAPIETHDLDRKRIPELRDRVREIVAGPVHADLVANPPDA